MLARSFLMESSSKLLVTRTGIKAEFDFRPDQITHFEVTPQPLYNTVHYNKVLYITRFKDGSQKCIDYIEK